MAGSLSRYVRSATLDVMGSDYLRNARAMGSTMGMAMLHHGLRNGAVPVISILGIELATAFLGAVVIEASSRSPASAACCSRPSRSMTTRTSRASSS